MPASYAVLFKIHFWDEFAKRQLERLKQRVGRGDIYVFVDQTGGVVGPIDHPPALTLRASETDLDIIGLPRFGSFSQFWWSADYALHLLTLRKPDYDYYAMIEFDVVLNVDLDPIVDRLSRDRIDFVSDPILDPPIEQFHWLYTAKGVYTVEEAKAWLTCIAFFSQHAARTLMADKLELGRRLASGEIDTLPMCELAIPTALSLAGCSMLPLAELGSIEHYKWIPPYDEGDLPNLADGAFVHPVLEGKRFVTNILRWYPDHTHFFDRDSFLWNRFKSQAAIQAALPVLYAEMRRDNRRDLCRQAIALMREHGDERALELHGLTDANLALNKPATQSSWIGGATNSEDPAGAVAGMVTGHGAFHTDANLRSWWMVDLQKPAWIDEIRVFNRLGLQERADGLVVSVALELSEWSEVGRHVGASFGGADGKPFVVKVGREARFVMTHLPRQEFLHLDQVQVIGHWI